ncbi:PAS domain-containing sensor histidine kinase [Pontibacter akesuensis]|uniref:histidine kinase n=1 Tax=Pontibacter akesuensis TaxID=388950 RepID=A0A1I7KWN5_9BACT|nr:PAS domain-containing sensor histidine kinase [Pontibacter akesuensis]GHA80604.1 hypothetical protein GCM10007389_38670 [Pontibacter akesuensis]SFV01845.1 two-component system, OmpR family, sensor histidine kinase VicK [Pontibacter akesuensis]
MPHIPTDTTILSLLAKHTKHPTFLFEVASKRLAFINQAFEKAFNMTTGTEVSPEELQQVVHPEDREYVREAYKRLLEEKDGKEVEFRAQLPGQQVRWFCLTPYMAGDADGKVFVVGSVEDITASRQYNDYLKKYSAKKNSILHLLAHDLAGPLGLIGSLSEVLAEETRQYRSTELNKLVELIASTSAHSVAMIKDLTNHEFLETTGVDLIKRRVNMVEKFKEVIEQYRKSEGEIRKTFVFEPSSDTIFAALDDAKFMQAINNLISNAIKFTYPGGIISVRLQERAQSVLVEVEDNGVGIPEKFYDILFDKFTNARRPGLNGEPSTGLGMSIIKMIVEWHSGEIWFKSEEGKGTTFYIEVPKE